MERRDVAGHQGQLAPLPAAEIITRLSWDCLVRLSSPSMPAMARQAIEARVIAGENIVASDIVRARQAAHASRKPAESRPISRRAWRRKPAYQISMLGNSGAFAHLFLRQLIEGALNKFVGALALTAFPPCLLLRRP